MFSLCCAQFANAQNASGTPVPSASAQLQDGGVYALGTTLVISVPSEALSGATPDATLLLTTPTAVYRYLHPNGSAVSFFPTEEGPYQLSLAWPDGTSRDIASFLVTASETPTNASSFMPASGSSVSLNGPRPSPATNMNISLVLAQRLYALGETIRVGLDPLPSDRTGLALHISRGTSIFTSQGDLDAETSFLPDAPGNYTLSLLKDGTVVDELQVEVLSTGMSATADASAASAVSVAGIASNENPVRSPDESTNTTLAGGEPVLTPQSDTAGAQSMQSPLASADMTRAALASYPLVVVGEEPVSLPQSERLFPGREHPRSAPVAPSISEAEKRANSEARRTLVESIPAQDAVRSFSSEEPLQLEFSPQNAQINAKLTTVFDSHYVANNILAPLVGSPIGLGLAQSAAQPTTQQTMLQTAQQSPQASPNPAALNLSGENTDLPYTNLTLSLTDAQGNRIDAPLLFERENASSYRFTIDARRGVRPGLYRLLFEDPATGASEERWFSYGLISVNTEHPLYHPAEQAKLIIVVLNSAGVPIADAPITLLITAPDGSQRSFSTDQGTILPTAKRGVYETTYDIPQGVAGNALGNYTVAATAMLGGIVVNISTFFAVEESFAYDIVRTVPATIDPNLGPFRNEFIITALTIPVQTNSSPESAPEPAPAESVPVAPAPDSYSLTEYVPASFIITTTNADDIRYMGDAYVLTWFNVSSGVAASGMGASGERPYYEAQAPLLSPYLYELGRAQIHYVDATGAVVTFEEARPWLFAIDPAALSCSSSPCDTGSSVNGRDTITGGAEPNQPNTINACTDGTSGTYHTDESLDRIIITDLNHTRFTAGDTIQVNFTVWCYGTTDNINWVYTNNSVTPVFRALTSTTCPSGGSAQTFSRSFVLDDLAGNHTVRGVYQYGGTAATTCGAGGYDDNDDVTLLVRARDTTPPTIISTALNATIIPINGSVTITSEVTDNDSGVGMVNVTVRYPNGTLSVRPMDIGYRDAQETTTNLESGPETAYAMPGTTTTTFNFSDSSNNKAYYGSVTAGGAQPLSWVLGFSAGTQASAACYTNLSSSNNVYCRSGSTTANAYPWFRFDFNTTGITRSDIQWLYVAMEAARVTASGTEDIACVVANLSSSAWERINGSTDTTVERTQTMNWSASVISNIVNSTGHAYFGFHGFQFDNNEYMNADFVQIIVGYNSSSAEQNGSWVTYTDVSSSLWTTISSLNITVNVTYYNSTGSSSAGNADPDLQLELYNGTDWMPIGNFSVGATGLFSLETTDPVILTAWEQVTNRDLRIRGSSLDYWNSTQRDNITFNGVWVTAAYEQAIYVLSWNDTAAVGLYNVTSVWAQDNDGNSNQTNYTNITFLVLNYAVPSITILNVENDTTETYSFTNQTPIVNTTIDTNATCYLSTQDETYAQMVANGRVSCGAYVLNVPTSCSYSQTLSVGSGTLHMACNNTLSGVANNVTNNKDFTIDVLCNAHADCAANHFCDYTSHCAPDIIDGFECKEATFDNQSSSSVCGGGADPGTCVNDSTFLYTGWYCAKNSTNCVFNDSGNTYDQTYALCSAVAGPNDYRSCSASQQWSAIIDCGDLNAGTNASANASTHPGGNCSYYAAAQTCGSGLLSSPGTGCNGNTTSCGGYIYSGSGVCGNVLADCDQGCGANCDPDTDVIPAIVSGTCHYDKTCSNACSYSESTELAPSFCIDDNDGGACVRSNRSDPSAGATCYWSPDCQNTVGASLTQGTPGNLKADYCDYCTVAGNQSGQYAPTPNDSCASDCENSGTIWYDLGATPLDRSNDCNATGGTTIHNDTLTSGDVWDGTSPATCDNAECGLDAGPYLTGACVGGAGGVCTFSDPAPPDLTIISPGNGSWFKALPAVFGYSVIDLGSGVKNCSLLINGAIVNTTNFPAQGTPLDLSSSPSLGSFTWSIECYDNSSQANRAWSGTFNSGYDNSLPTLSNPAINGTLFSINQRICLNITVTDTYSGVAQVQAQVTLPAPYGTTNLTLTDSPKSCDPAGGNNVYSIEYQLVYSGQFNWTTVYAQDAANNQNSLGVGLAWNVSTAGYLSVVRNSPNQNVTINESGTNSSFLMNCTVFCTDQGSNCANVSLATQYDPGNGAGLWTAINTSSANLSSNESSFFCGNLNVSGRPDTGDLENGVVSFSTTATNATKTYDFSDSSNNKAYYGSVTAGGAQPLSWALGFSAGTAASASCYTNLSSSNNAYCRSGSTTANAYPWFRFDFNTTGIARSDIQWLYVKMESGRQGASGTEDVANVFANLSSSGWERINGSTDTTVEANQTMNWSAAVIPNIVNTTGHAYFGLQGFQFDNPENITADYVQMIIGYNGSTAEQNGSWTTYTDVSASPWRNISRLNITVDVTYYNSTGSSSAGNADPDLQLELYNGTDWVRIGNFSVNDVGTFNLSTNNADILSAWEQVTNRDLRIRGSSLDYWNSTQRDNITYSDISIIATYQPGLLNCSHVFNISSAGDLSGNNSWPVRCRGYADNAPNNFSSGINVTVNDHPNATIISPRNNTWVHGNTTVNGSTSFDSDGSIVNFRFEYDNTTAFASPSVICNGAANSCAWNTSQQDQCLNNTKSCYLRFIATDNLGLNTTSAPVLLGFDTNGPTTTLIRPSNLANISSATSMVNATVNDSEVGNISRVLFEYRENASVGWKSACNDTDGNAPFNCTWNLAGLPDGTTYEFRAYANDTLGNMGATDSHTGITIDRTPPNVTLITPQNRTFSLGNETLFYNTTDVTSAVANCTLILDGNPSNTTQSPPEGVTLNFSVVDLSEMTHTWRVNCSDALGNTGASETRTLIVERTGPVTTLDQPPTSGNAYGLFTVNATINDTGVGNISVVFFEYRETGADIWYGACDDTDHTAPYACVWDTTGLPDGAEYQVRAWANDSLGNLGSASTHVQITVDNNGPQISDVSPGDGARDTDGNVFFFYTVDDIGSSVANCSLFIDGTLNQTRYFPPEGQQLQFNLTGLNDSTFTWMIECWDSFAPQPHRSDSGDRTLTVEILYLLQLNLTTDKTLYEKGNQVAETANISANTTDAINESLASALTVDIIKDGTATPWWNTNWTLRRPLNLTSPDGRNRTNEIVRMNLTGLGGYISSCANQPRIVQGYGAEQKTDIPFSVESGDDSTWCSVRFLANVSATNATSYYVYYNNTGASAPGYGAVSSSYVLNRDMEGSTNWTYYENEASDTGAYSTTRYHSSTYSYNIYSGTAATVGNYAEIYQDVRLPCVGCSVTVSAYNRLESAGTSANIFAGQLIMNSTLLSSVPTPGSAASPTDWTLRSGAYTTLAATERIHLRFLSNFTFASGYSRRDVYWDDIDITLVNPSTSALGGAETFVVRNSTATTGATGFWTWLWNVLGRQDGVYLSVGLATKTKYNDAVAAARFNITDDFTGPGISLITPDEGSEQNSSVTFSYQVVDLLSTVTNCSLIIDSEVDEPDPTIQEGLPQFFYPRIPSGGPHNWSVCCQDYFGNENCSVNRTVIIIPPDLATNTGNITVSPGGEHREGQNLTINATIWNIGGSNAVQDFLVQLWDGNPETGGTQIGQNYSINLTDRFGDHSNETLSWTWVVARPGTSTLYVVIDPPLATNGSILEILESNNEVLFNISTSAYVTIYGNITATLLLDTKENHSLSNFSGQRRNTGLVFFSDSEEVISFNRLQALGRKISNASATTDFSDADALLNMTSFNDSINQVWAQGSNAPQQTMTILVSQKNITNVPVVNSSVSGSFKTGILWDTSRDTGNGEYDTTDKEPIVFFAEINSSSAGDYGTYDYQSKVPALLRSYAGSAGLTIAVYYELQ
jgi:hypothetical protein